MSPRARLVSSKFDYSGTLRRRRAYGDDDDREPPDQTRRLGANSPGSRGVGLGDKFSRRFWHPREMPECVTASRSQAKEACIQCRLWADDHRMSCLCGLSRSLPFADPRAIYQTRKARVWTACPPRAIDTRGFALSPTSRPGPSAQPAHHQIANLTPTHNVRSESGLSHRGSLLGRGSG
jgi:hypothetical protein